MLIEPFIFTPIEEADFPLLHRWLNTPRVKEWWHADTSYEVVQEKYRAKLNSPDQQIYIVEQTHQPFAFIQAYRASNVGSGWWPNELASTIGVDQFIGESAFLNRGFGSQLIRVFTDWLLSLPENEKIITDPSSQNARAIRAYEKAGFISTRIVETPDGPALLMEKTGKSSAAPPPKTVPC